MAAHSYEKDLIYMIGFIAFLIIVYASIKGGLLPDFKYQSKWSGLRDTIRSINEPAGSK